MKSERRRAYANDGYRYIIPANELLSFFKLSIAINQTVKSYYTLDYNINTNLLYIKKKKKAFIKIPNISVEFTP